MNAEVLAAAVLGFVIARVGFTLRRIGFWLLATYVGVLLATRGCRGAHAGLAAALDQHSLYGGGAVWLAFGVGVLGGLSTCKRTPVDRRGDRRGVR